MRHWLVGLLIALPALAQEEAIVEVNGNGKKVSERCEVLDVIVGGNDNEVYLTGECNNVQVDGNKNRIQLELALSIQVNGRGNQIRYKFGEPEVSDLGSKNKIERAAEAPAGKSTALVISLQGTTQTLECGGRDVTIQGASNQITLTGDCQKVTVSGAGNTVRLDGAAQISALGAGNQISWKRGVGGAKKPKISSAGLNNKITRRQD